jgi:hypothetical protein
LGGAVQRFGWMARFFGYIVPLKNKGGRSFVT